MRSRIFKLIMLAAFVAGWASTAAPEVIDRVVALVGDEAILLSELEEAREQTARIDPSVGREEVLNTLVNRRLLLVEARKFSPEPAEEERLINEYIDLKVRAFIRVPEEEVRRYYDEHREDLGRARYEEVKDRIEDLLEEKELNRRLESHLEVLRGQTYIRKFLEGPPAR